MQALFVQPSEVSIQPRVEYLPNGIRLVFMHGAREAAYTRVFRNEMWCKIGLELLEEALSEAPIVLFPWRRFATELPCWEISPPGEETALRFISMNGKPILFLREPDSCEETQEMLRFLQSDGCKKQLKRIREVSIMRKRAE